MSLSDRMFTRMRRQAIAVSAAACVFSVATMLPGWSQQGRPTAAPTAAPNRAPAPSKAANGDTVLAIVNAETITQRQVGQEAILRYGNDIVDSMVDRYLVIQACKEGNINITSQDIQNEVLRTAKKFGLSPEAYLQLLQEERDISPEQYSKDVIWPMLALRALVTEGVSIGQEEFNQAFIAEFGESVKCRMILMRDRAKLEQVLAEAKANPDQFGQLATEYSEDDSSASVRGLIPPIRHYMGDPALETLAFSLKEGDISEPYALGDDWIVLQCVRRLAATPPAEEAFPQIREQIVDRLRDEKIRVEANKLFVALREKAQVVKVFGDKDLEAQYPGVAAVINGQKLTIAQVSEEAVNRHGKEILAGEINRRLLTQALKKANRQVTDEDMNAEIERAAKSYGYIDEKGNADVAAWFNEVLQDPSNSLDKSIELYKRDAVWPSAVLKKLIATVEVSEEDLVQAYEKNFGPRVEVLAIVLADQRTAQAVWEQARKNPTDQFFGELAAQYSIEPTSQSNFGKVPPIRKFGGQPTIEKEAFHLQPGQMSGLIATGDKYVILRCQGFTKPLVTEMAAVREDLIAEVYERKERVAMAAEFDRIKNAAQIDNFLEGTTQDGAMAKAPSGTVTK